MRVCIRKSDKRIIEAQSDCSKAVLIKNAASAGLKADSVKIVEMSDDEFNEALAAQAEQDNPTPKTPKQKVVRLLEQNGLTLADLKAALK